MTDSPYLSNPQAPPALLHADAEAGVAGLDGGSVGHLKQLHMVLKHGVGLSRYVPGAWGAPILRTIHRLPWRRGGKGVEGQIADGWLTCLIPE